MRVLFLLIFSVLFSNLSFGQSFSLATFAQFNTSFIGIKSKKEILSDITLKPWFGFNTGIVGGFHLNKNSRVDVAVSFKQIRNQGNPISFTNVMGEKTGGLENITIANYNCVGATYNYKLVSNFSIGTGLNLNILGQAKTKIKVPEDIFGNPISVNGLPLESKYNNYAFRRFNLAIPIVINYEIKRVLLSLNFEKGILSRVKSSEVKERENILSLGMGILLIKAEPSFQNSAD
jgi:hypothetical protein